MFIFVPYSSRRFLYDSRKTCTFFIGGNPIVFVYSFSHLGHLLTNKFTDSSDVLKRRGDFVGQVNVNMLCYFCKLTSFVKIGYFNAVSILVFMGVSCGYSPLTKLKICASRGVKFHVESGACRILLILIFCLYIESMFTFVRWDLQAFNQFIRSCLSNESSLVMHISQYAVFHGRALSCVGQNVLLCIYVVITALFVIYASPRITLSSLLYFVCLTKICTVLLIFYLS